MCPCRARPAMPGRRDRSAAGVRDRTDRTPRSAGPVPQRSSRGSSGHQRSSMVRRNRRSPAFQLAQQGRCVRVIRIVVRRSSNVLNSRVNALGSSTVKVAAPAAAAAVHLGSELAFQLHEAPDPGAVHAELGLDVGGQLADGVPGRRRAVPRTAAAVPRSAGPGSGRVRSPPGRQHLASSGPDFLPQPNHRRFNPKTRSSKSQLKMFRPRK
jgi:hypothetical protein